MNFEIKYPLYFIPSRKLFKVTAKNSTMRKNKDLHKWCFISINSFFMKMICFMSSIIVPFKTIHKTNLWYFQNQKFSSDMRKDRARVFYVQINNLRSVNFKRKTPIKYYLQGIHLSLLKRKKYRVLNFEANFLKIILLVIEQYDSHVTCKLHVTKVERPFETIF